MKKYYYVAVMHPDNTFDVVTEVDYSTKVAKWEKGKKGFQMKKNAAEELAMCLCMNMFIAFVITSTFEFQNEREETK